MREQLPNLVEYGRQPGSDKSYGPNGHFVLAHNRVTFVIIASNGEGWEHVSVHVAGQERTPTWDEMCWIKDQFWYDTETVIQYHPPRREYVNIHPYVLHLWRKVGENLELPPQILV